MAVDINSTSTKVWVEKKERDMRDAMDAYWGQESDCPHKSTFIQTMDDSAWEKWCLDCGETVDKSSESVIVEADECETIHRLSEAYRQNKEEIEEARSDSKGICSTGPK
jgi:hypothetical protein